MKQVYLTLLFFYSLLGNGQTVCNISYSSNNFENAELGLNIKYIANDFDVAAGVTLEIEKFIPTIVNNITTANIFIYEDNNGQPGQLITSFEDVVPNSQTQVSSNFNLPWYEVELELPEIVSLEGGADGTKYWFGLFVTMGTDGHNFNFWEVKTNGTNELLHFSVDQGDTWTASTSGFDGVFEVIGNCSSESPITFVPCEIVEEGNNFENAELGLNIKYIANDFDVAAGVTLEIEKFIPTIVNNITTANIFIYEDNNGQPGQLITSFEDVVPNSQTQVSDSFNLPWYEVELELPEIVSLEGGADGTKYWFGLFVTMGTDGHNFNFWEVKTNGTNELLHFSVDQGDTWTASTSGFDGVFEIIGNCGEEIIFAPCEIIEEGNNFENAELGLNIKYIANDFDIAAGVTLEIEKFIPTIVNNITTANIFIYEDNNGQPGQLITSFEDVVPNSQTQVSDSFNLPWYEVELELPEVVSLEGGADGTKYWVGLFVTMGTDGHNFNFWEVKTNGTNELLHYSVDQGDTWTASTSGFDGVFEIIGNCGGVSEIPDVYCEVEVVNEVEPITRVVFTEIDNTTSAETTAPAQEYFLNIEGNVEQGGSYDISLEGNTNGNETNYFTVFIDWNQNEILDDEGEVYHIGTITNSDGTDGQQVTGTITVPYNIPLGATRMRIIKSNVDYTEDPCEAINSGQTEDYTLIVTQYQDDYCEVDVVVTVEPITRVVFNDIDNTSSVSTSSPAHEYFLNIEGNVNRGESYEIAIEGKSHGSGTEYYTVFFDWNQNGILDDEGEVYQIGTITNSTGTDGQQAINTIEIPFDAELGSTRMRIVKWHLEYPEDPCSNLAFGQVEDYTININDYQNTYCDVVISDTTSPITNVNFAGINNSSSASTDADGHEIFVYIEGNGEQGGEYTIKLKGNTNGNNTHYFTAFIDWNQNGILDDEGEIYELGSITNSTGTDEVVLTSSIQIPSDALLGTTRLRIIKSADSSPTDPCGTYPSGQAEDYSLNVFEYCGVNSFNVTPITKVVFAGIDNASSPDPSSPVHELFLDIEATVLPGESYPITLEGNTVGLWYSCFTVFIDWNQNGILDDEGEVYNIECIFGSTGTDGQQAIGTIEVPEDALLGSTRMRIVSLGDYDDFTTDPCGLYSYAQVEDYTVIVTDTLLPVCEIECPDDMVIEIPEGQTSAEVDYQIVFNCDEPDGVELILVEGLASGSEFPLGETNIVYNLEFDGEVIASCSFSVTVETILSSESFDNDNFIIYPNPVKDIINILYVDIIDSITLFDISGKQVINKQGKQKEIQMDLSNLSSGVYMARIISGNTTKILKVVKQ